MLIQCNILTNARFGCSLLLHMDSRVISSIAILKVNWDTLGQDYIESFIPFVTQCIISLNSRFVSAPVIQARMLSDFGLQVPQNALKVILPRIAKKGFVRREGEIYFPNYSTLGNLNFETTRQRIIREHNALVEKLIRFTEERYHEKLDPDRADEILMAYISERDVEILSCSVSGALPPPLTSIDKYDYIIHSFVKYVSETDPEGFKYLDTVVKGHMLANALLFMDIDSIPKKFRGTSTYCDTSLLIQALGYEGESRRIPCRELLDLIHELGAKPRCFHNTRNEVHGILYAIMSSLGNKQQRGAYHAAFHHFTAAGYKASDIQLELTKLDRRIEELGIEICDKPEYVPALQIDEEELERAVQSGVGYAIGSARARQHDIDCITSIHRLRKGITYPNFEDCIALFVTCNAKLAYSSAKFFKKENLIPSGMVPIAVTDYALTTILWLKRPTSHSQLPQKYIIAQSYAAMAPNDHLWRKYLATISSLEKRGDISSDDYYILRSLPQAREELMELTLGDEKSLVENTPKEILEKIRQAIRTEESVIAQTERNQRLEAEHKLSEEKQAKLEREQSINLKIEYIARRLAFWISRSILGLIILLLGLGAWASFPGNLLRSTSPWVNYLLSITQILLAVAGLYCLISGRGIMDLVGHLESRLIQPIEKRLKAWILPEPQ